MLPRELLVKLNTANVLSLENDWLFAGVLGLLLSCLWITPFPPLVDLAQHTAQIVTLQELWAGNPRFTETFELNWFAPYTASYLIIYLFALVLPVTVAAKLVVTLAVAAVPLLAGRLFAAAGAYPGWKWLLVPASFGVAFYWGFVPFMLAVPAGLYLLLLTLRFSAAPTLLLGLMIAACTVALFFLHVIGLGFAALLCVTWIAAVHYKQPGKVLLLWLPYMTGLPLLAYWYLRTLQSETYVQGAGVIFGPLSDRLLTLLSQSAGLGALAIGPSAVIVAGLMVFPYFSGARLSHRPERLAIPVMATLVFLLMPATAFGSIYLYQRLSIFLLPAYLLAWEYPQGHRPRWMPAVILVVSLLVLVNVARFTAFANETRGFQAMLAEMEPNANVMYMPAMPVTAGFAEPVHFHTGVWYQAEKRGIVDFNFAFFFPSMVRFREGQHAWVPNDSVVWQPLQFEWERSNGAHYDYFLIHSMENLQAPMFKNHQDKVELVANQDWWWLFRKVAD